MYLTSKQKLFSELMARTRKKEEIMSRINIFVERKYGIADFSRMVDEFFKGFESRVLSIMCRQVPSVFIEDIAVYLISRLIDIRPVALSLFEDCFMNMSEYKIALVKMMFIEWSAKGNMVKKNQRLTAENPQELNKRVLADIITQQGLSLPYFHLQMRERLFGDSYPVRDISDFFRKCLVLAKVKPEFVYQKAGDCAVRLPFSDADLKICRPPCDWYYPLYFLFFLINKVQFETYEELSDPSVSFVFKSTMEEIRENIGFYPMVVKILNFKEMAFVNKHLISLNGTGCQALNQIAKNCSVRSNDDLFALFKDIVNELTIFGRPAV